MQGVRFELADLYRRASPNSANGPIVIPTNDRAHRNFIARVRRLNSDGLPKFSAERLLVLTDKQFRDYKGRFGYLGAPDIALVISAYRERVGLSRALS